jgi:hypothetical protein
MVKGTNLVWKDNPRWPIGNAPETIKVQAVGSPYLRGPAAPRPRRRPTGLIRAVADAFCAACASLAGWLAGILHRAGGRLFVRNDEEAGWRGWQPTELRCGLARSYRDTRFDVLHLIRDIDNDNDNGSGSGSGSGTQPPGACPPDGDR